MTTSLRHATHPLQLRAIEVVGTGYLRPLGVDALLPLLQVIGVVAPIGIDGMVVQLHDDGAHTIQEEAVVGHHQQCPVTPCQIALQPFYHLQIKVVGRLVEDQQVGLHQQHIGESHPLLLTATQLSHRLVEVTYLQLCQHLLCLQHFLLLPMMIETGIEDTLLRVELRGLLQETDCQVTTEDDITSVMSLLSRQYREQRRLTRAVFRYQAHLLPLSDTETDIAKQVQRAERLRQVLHVNVWGILRHYCLISLLICSM